MNKWIYLVLSLGLGWTSPSVAIIPLPDIKEPTTRFYRTPQSLFPSGTKELKILRSSTIQTKEESWYLVENQEQKEWVPQSRLFFFKTTIKNLSGVPSNTIQHLSTPLIGLLKENSNSLRYQHGWRTGGVIKEGSLINLNSLRSDWACGEDATGSVCVRTSSLILSSDTAERVKLKNGKWFKIKDRQNNLLITSDGKKLPLNKVVTWESDKNFAFIAPNKTTGSISNFIQDSWTPYAKVAILKKEVRRWHQSLLTDHGNIWWQDIPAHEVEESPIIITKEELIGRPILFSSNNLIKTDSNKNTSRIKSPSIVSANGIFYSNDNGESWNYLKQFGDSNYPVAIGPRNSIIVGDQISFNQGKSFQNYLRWDQITHLVQNSLHRSPSQLLLTSLKPLNSSNFEITIDTGNQKMLFEINLINNQLRILK